MRYAYDVKEMNEEQLRSYIPSARVKQALRFELTKKEMEETFALSYIEKDYYYDFKMIENAIFSYLHNELDPEYFYKWASLCRDAIWGHALLVKTKLRRILFIIGYIVEKYGNGVLNGYPEVYKFGIANASLEAIHNYNNKYEDIVNPKMKENAFYKETALGPLSVEIEDDKVVNISFEKEVRINTNINIFSDDAFVEIDEYLQGKRKKFTFPYTLKGTAFQLNVWKCILDIPYGETKTYKEIAQEVDNVNAYRAVANACNANKLALVIPCHRVVGSNNKMGGYKYGIQLKQKLLEMEKNNK
ncbi:MAG: methylated-DNA--[protein]-cysteine S-methyltransferase [Acholeplasmatales bacterium]|nr:methylated-DNA--[protein]-cysteine S-methyltransferase [Acholeplasmatales bacterium]